MPRYRSSRSFRGRTDLESANRIQSLTSTLGAPVFATEDVNGAWAQAYSIPEDSPLSWRLLRPAGGVSWMHDGELQGERLSGVLDACLIPGTPSRFASIDAPLRPGVQLNASAFHLGIADLEAVQSRCPPRLPAGSAPSWWSPSCSLGRVRR